MLKTRRFSAITALVAVFALALSGLALASTVDVAVVDVTAPTNAVSLEAGTNAPITINMTVTGNQAAFATFKVNRDWTLSGGSFIGSNPETFTVPARSAQDAPLLLSTAGIVTVVSGHVPASHTLAVPAFDIINATGPGGKLSAGQASNYSVTVTAPAPPANTAPTVSVTGVTDGASYEFGSVPAATCSVVDAEDGNSTFAASLSTITGTLSSHGLGSQTATCSYTDNGGLTDSDSATYSIVDTTKPIVALVDGPQDGQTYYVPNVPPSPTCTATDNVAVEATGCVLAGYSANPGTHTITANATDVAGNTAQEVSVTYSVRHITSAGYTSPVRLGTDVVNRVKGGSTVPLKFSVFENDGDTVTEVTATTGMTFSVSKYTCDSGDNVEAVAETTTGSTSLRYDTAGQQFIQNWKTPTTVGCYRANIQVPNGPLLTAQFQVTK